MTTTGAFLAESLDGRWRPGIGDPTVMGWVTVAAYLAVAVLCGRVARRGHLVWFWGALAVALVLLGINKQLDLQSLGTQIARHLAKQQGWYAARHQVQQVFIFGVLAGGVLFLGAMTVLLRDHWRRTRLALFGLVFLFAFVLIRAASFNRVDTLIGVRVAGLKMNWILELGSLLLIGLGAARNLRRDGARRLLAWIVVGLGLVSGTACGGRGKAPATGPARLEIRVERSATDRRDLPRVTLEFLDGDAPLVEAPRLPFRERDDTVFDDLESGRYRVRAQIGVALNGPWYVVEREVVLAPSSTTRVTVAPPDGRAALAVLPAKDTPPFVLLLLASDAAYPTTLEELRTWMKSRPGFELGFPGVVFRLQRDGRQRRYDLTPLAAGRFVAWVMANDWEPDDPPIAPHALEIELEDGETTLLHLEDRLQRLRAEPER